MLAGVLVALDEANGNERAMARVRVAPGRHARRIQEDEWRLLAHPELDLALSRFYSVLWPAVLSLKGKTDRDAGLSPRYLATADQSALPFARIFHATSHRLGVSPRLFMRTDVQGGITHMPVWPRASLCGATLLEGFDAHDLAFVCASHCAWHLDSLAVFPLMPSKVELAALIRAGLRIAQLTPTVSAETESIALQLASRMRPLQVEWLQLAAERFRLASVPAAIELSAERWRRAAWLTSHRIGLALAPDLAVALRMIRACGPGFPGADTRGAEDELLRFAISARHATLVRALSG